MKFVTLALALLLAIGSQAVPLQADAPQTLAHLRSVLDMYMDNLKVSLTNAVNQMEDAEMKAKVVQHVDGTFAKIKAGRDTLAPMTDTVVATIMDATAEMRSTIEADVAALKEEIAPLETKLKEVFQSHMDEYKTKLGPIIEEYNTKHAAEMAAMRAKIEPVMEEMQGTIMTNVEETKNALIPILEAVRIKVHKWLANAKTAIEPYAVEYRDQASGLIANMQSITPEDIAALREKLVPLAQEANNNIQAMVGEITKVVTKS
ncbi:apolipoprotein A-I-like [Halichoeres trimaculatus]|uniref:apolipoprotein A-I-like n=1 Tax=Halichoeres trimaculatus TaxID=147232 RepID=UPI003D9E59BC